MIATSLVAAALPALAGAAPVPQAASTFTFCLQSPAAGRIAWTQRSTAAPAIALDVHGLPAAAGLLVFVDEGTSREAYDFTSFTTDAAGAAVETIRAFYYPGPTRVARLLLEDRLATVVATALPCAPAPALLPASGAGGARSARNRQGGGAALVLALAVGSIGRIWSLRRARR